MPVIRPMTEDDVFAALDLTNETFADLERRLGEEVQPFPDPAMATIRFRDLVRRDPGGSWVAEDEHGLAGCALALRREDVWGLSLLVVRPGPAVGRRRLGAAAPRARVRGGRAREDHPLLARTRGRCGPTTGSG